MALAGKRARLLGSGDSLAFTEESFSTEDDQTYIIDDQDKRVWDREQEITVYEDGVETTEDYELNRLTGQIIFETEDNTRGEITADGSYLAMATIAQANEYDYTLEADNAERNAFGDDYVKREQTLLDFTGSLERWHEPDDYFVDFLLDGQPLVIEFYSYFEEQGSENNILDLVAWCLLDSDGIAAVIDGLVEEDVSFEGTHDIDNRVVATG